VLDIDIAPSSFIFVDIAQKNIKPDRKETGRANGLLIAAAAKIWPATFRIYVYRAARLSHSHRFAVNTYRAPKSVGLGKPQRTQRSQRAQLFEIDELLSFILESIPGSHKFSGSGSSLMYHSSKDFIGTKRTKVTKLKRATTGSCPTERKI
jgi:hypothetical protein